MNLFEKDRLRFYAKVAEREPDACWPWQAGTDRNGYGQFKLNGRCVEAHRVAFALDRGKTAEAHVLHTCDNRPCCNPGHLYEGTHGDNMADAAARGRQRGVARPGNGHTKIDGNTSLKIAKLCERGATYSAVARLYDVTPPTARAHHRRHAV